MTERRLIRVGGIVQGVGFRPFVHGLASRHRVHGFVRNHAGDVVVEVEGEADSIERFLDELVCRPPPLAQIDRVSCARLAPVGDGEFRIEASEPDRSGQVLISPDVATCPECLAELFDAGDRRFAYPFLNCTNCGPRLTIVTGAPYDRARTTMAPFVMCAGCRSEYENAGHRRFHAEPTACGECGPRLRLLEASGDPVECEDPLRPFAEALCGGGIGAMKGLGGYHLVCDARNEAAVEELRRRKHRDEKPFAVMVRDVEAAEALCEINALERELLVSRRSPIVLLRKRGSRIPQNSGALRTGSTPDERVSRASSGTAASRPNSGEFGYDRTVADAVAPGNPSLGVLLPYTPLHHLLMRQVGGIPLVMTSGNRSDEPIAYREPEALERLRGIADLFLVHDRPIHVRCDDSVTRVVGGCELPVRRSRGYAPQPIALPMDCSRPILAVGGQLKATFALGQGRHAVLSHHLGDLDHYEAYRAFETDVTLYEQLFAVQPECVVHDLHPDYASTRYALTAGRTPLTRLAVQHHHAHMASCMAEHGLTEPVIGVIFDGAGYGTDGAVWGGEFLVGDYCRFQRAAHLRSVGMPGGEQAIREPWRMAAAHLLDAACAPTALCSRVPPGGLQTVERMLKRRLNSPRTSSAGRLFDAVAAIAGVRDRVSFEGQAAMELEWLATETGPDGVYPFELIDEIEDGSPGPALIVDTRPLIRAVARDANRPTGPAAIARRFHSTLVEMIAAVCTRVRRETGVATVVLSGGVFMNALLTGETVARLSGEGFAVHRHRLVPPNDGGLSLGQLAIAAGQLSARKPIATARSEMAMGKSATSETATGETGTSETGTSETGTSETGTAEAATSHGDGRA